ncbi:Cof-type HAD-IIB family hydrolase [Paenibacillus sp. FSL K6-2524]|uniref:Cof-type HAD-IIB family hydrolase n=1 Tax=Paenibacillus sp. FSL K6-2524 TaxID=2954516 RepID=UPI0030F81E7D
MNYKLIALDVDGTLLSDNHELTEGTMETIKKIAEQGTEFVLCTGRAPGSSIPFMKQMGLEGYIITHNGAATVDVRTEEIIHEFAMNPHGLDSYIDYCHKNNVHFDVNTTFALYVQGAAGLSQEALDLYGKFMVVPKELPGWADMSEPIVKFTVTGQMEELDKVYADWSLWTQEFNMLRSGDFFIDLMHKEASKGAALKKLAEKRGIPAENVMAIGNYYNDLTMLTFAGLGVAMDNSPLEVKAAANAITASNNDEGVKLALQKYCL